MAWRFVLFLFLSSLSATIAQPAQPATVGHHHRTVPPRLTLNYYAKTCPQFDQIVEDTVYNKQSTNPTTAAATLRLFFHDCMVDGCDASILISSTPTNTAERDQDINLSLAGDGFDVVTRIKNAVELACPNVVSCADILSVATRNLVKQVGGPFYQVQLGRKDGLVSMASHVEGNLATVNTSMDQMIEMFKEKGFTIEEMVALTGGGHTIGFSHCNQFSNRIFNYGSPSGVDPTLNPVFANRLKQICANYQANPTQAAFNDPMTPGTFDNMYFQNLRKGLGLLGTDQALMNDPRTKPIVNTFAANQSAFFDTFAQAMVKTSLVGVKTGKHGQVRVRCDRFN
ncbi:hypothetical protein Vadar_009593 [Vaccinium darrowii]|uniref:Uncharacterized protein n=1 Tax=Vaccinium darrowii TaxID=229202 RepID=A0ACB7YUJ1_9ERIC|nr:hypothetical protein Vadar_009593 [Vaccinium darrowii]